MWVEQTVRSGGVKSKKYLSLEHGGKGTETTVAVAGGELISPLFITEFDTSWPLCLYFKRKMEGNP